MSSDESQPGAGRASLALALTLAFCLRVVFVFRKGLVIDEFHTRFHALQTNWAEFWSDLLRDNHPPLSFAVIGAFARVLGDAEWALRSPAVLCGLLEVFLVHRLARRLGASGWWAALWIALSSLHLEYTTQARMYALLAVSVTGVLEAFAEIVTREPQEGARFARIRLGVFAWTALHSHYFGIHYIGWLVIGGAGAFLLVPELRPRLRGVRLPVLAALAAAAPWYATGFVTQLGHDLPPGGKDSGGWGLIEAFIHLFALNVRKGGPIGKWIFVLAGAFACCFAFLGAARILRSEGLRSVKGLVVLQISLVAFAVPLSAWGVARITPRAGFTWYYIVPSTAAMAVLVGVTLSAVPRRPWSFIVGAALTATGVLALLNVAGRGHEDYPAAVRTVLEQVTPEDAVVCAEFQPAVFPLGMPWDYYAPRLRTDPKQRFPVASVQGPRDSEALLAHERVFLIRTSLYDTHRLMRVLRERYSEEVRSGSRFGFQPELHVFSDPVR